MKSERIEFQNLVNTRDLGGIMTKDGRRIRKGKLLRSGYLYPATGKDLRKLYDEYDLRTVVDFRTPIEKQERPDPHYRDINVIDLCVQSDAQMGVTQDEESRRQARLYWQGIYANPPRAKQHMCGFYREIADDFCLERYATFLRMVKDEKHTILWHCSLGKDRAGIGTVLLMELLGVPRETVMEDYISTNDYLHPGEDPDMSVAGFFEFSHREYLDSFYDEMEKKFGTMENAFEKMGLDEEFAEELRNKYLEEI